MPILIPIIALILSCFKITYVYFANNWFIQGAEVRVCFEIKKA